MTRELTRDERRKQFIDTERHEWFGLIMDALVQARELSGAELSKWLSLKSAAVNRKLGKHFDEFNPDAIAPAPSTNGTPTNGATRLTVRA